MTQAIPEAPLDGAADDHASPEVETPAASVVDIAADKVAARAAVASALAAGKVNADSSFDAVRFQVDAAVPVWALKGAWEEAKAAIPRAPDPEPWDRGDDGPPPDDGDPLAAFEHPDGAQRPTIRIVAGELTRMIRETVRALGEGDPNLFQRAGELVRIVREPERREPYETDTRVGSNILTRPGTPKIAPAGDVLLERCDAVAAWERFDARRGGRGGGGHGGKASGEWVPANPDMTTVRQVIARKDWPGVAPVRGILETPCLAPSERIIMAPGYDEETGYFLLPSCNVGQIADAPPREHARRALRYLWTETACDFPFAGIGESDPARDPDRVARFDAAIKAPDAFVALAMLLTIFARGAILGAVPSGVFEAAGQGSGKSLQIHVNAMIATSRAASVATFPVRDGRPNEEELEKIIMGYALAGARIVAFDNIRGLLAGSTLERAQTSVDNIDGRILGLTGQHSVPWWAVLMFSGNNMVMSDDVAQRSLIARLESPREDPRSRPASTFRHPDLLAWVKAHRARLVRAALVILRSYLAARAAGDPAIAEADTGTRGSFEAWAAIVPPAIVWAGGPNMLRAFPEAGRGGDEEGEAHTTLMRHWRPEWQNQRASVILEGLFRGEKDAREGGPPDGLDDARSAARALTRTRERETPSSHVLGIRLRGLRGKIRGGMRIEAGEDAGRGVAVWRVVEIGVP